MGCGFRVATLISGDMGSGSASDFTEIQVTAGGQYHVTDTVGLGIDVNVNGATADTATFYVRWNF